MSTFDQAENADTDAKTLAALFGTKYDPQKSYVMYIIDRGENFELDGSDIFVPTFENIRKKLKTDFNGELSPKIIDEIMNENYSSQFRLYWKHFNEFLSDSEKEWYSSFDTNEAKFFSANYFNNESDIDTFISRQKILSEIGAWEVFTGDGLTEFNGIKGKPGALEILEIQHSPKTINELLEHKEIIKIEL
ncbi:hypothetical protein ACQKP8_26880 [Photobacterium alginatilyticum]|uniref:hypothetical protein n=1 Tax=Photobacterium alginatilyticum TaxID=1775171 RepID=UPI004067725D